MAAEVKCNQRASLPGKLNGRCLRLLQSPSAGSDRRTISDLGRQVRRPVDQRIGDRRALSP
jgi:hypothetical protein